MRHQTLAAASLIAVLIAPAARAQCTVDPNDTNPPQGFNGTAGQALSTLLFLSAPVNFYKAGLTTQQAIDQGEIVSLNYAQAAMSVIQRQATTFPVGSSLGGFSYTFDPSIGLPVRRTDSFGPMFADRPQSSGLHKFSMSLSGQVTGWTAFGGTSLADGLSSLQAFPASITDSGHPETLYAVVKMSFVSNRSVLGLNYGLTSKLDVGVLLTYGSAVVDGTLHAVSTDLTTGKILVIDGRHYCGASQGKGDVAIRAKYEFLSRRAVDLAVGLEVRLPTGVPEDALGVGSTQTKLLLIGAFPQGRVAPHFNLGFVYVPGYAKGVTNFGNSANIKNAQEADYTVGADMALTHSLTISGDVIGRSLINSYNFEPTVTGDTANIAITPGTVTLLLGAVGGKLLLGHSWLLNMSVAFPLNNAGLKPGLTPVLGLERAF